MRNFIKERLLEGTQVKDVVVSKKKNKYLCTITSYNHLYDSDEYHESDFNLLEDYVWLLLLTMLTEMLSIILMNLTDSVGLIIVVTVHIIIILYTLCFVKNRYTVLAFASCIFIAFLIIMFVQNAILSANSLDPECAKRIEFFYKVFPKYLFTFKL